MIEGAQYFKLASYSCVIGVRVGVLLSCIYVMVFPTRCFPYSLIFSDGFDATNRKFIRIEWRGGLGRSLGRASLNNEIIPLGSKVVQFRLFVASR